MSYPESNVDVPAPTDSEAVNSDAQLTNIGSIWNQAFLGKPQCPDSKPGMFFLISRKVTIAYGPHEVLGVMDYRTERLEGLKNVLKKAGGEPVLKPSYHLNQVRIWHLERLIFSCMITDLQHCGDGSMDKLCMEAAEALDKSALKAYANLKNRYKTQRHLNAMCPCHLVAQGVCTVDSQSQVNPSETEDKKLRQ